MNDPVVRVVFRMGAEQEVFALMPFEIADLQGNCTCYQRIGGHCAANYQLCMSQSRPATPEEYAPLKEEMEKMGYKLKIIKRRSR